jgi:hypothetical protein
MSGVAFAIAVCLAITKASGAPIPVRGAIYRPDTIVRVGLPGLMLVGLGVLGWRHRKRAHLQPTKR